MFQKSVLIVSSWMLLLGATAAQAEMKVAPVKGRVQIFLDGDLYATYHSDFNGTPIVWPIYGPTGKKMTRDYPMTEGPESERQDHPHHRSLWFNHGDVNGRSFWHEDSIVQTDMEVTCDGETAVIETENEWVNEATGKKLCKSARRYTFGELEGGARYIDFDVTVTALQDEVVFGDTKEGCFGVRVPGTMKVDAKSKNDQWGGTIVNRNGEKDKEAWGKRAAWVDYYGPVEGETLGVAILNHPESFRFPTWWHVRTYGLFAANPFGLSYFEGGDEDGTLKLKKGDSFSLSYRVIFHEGDADQASIEERFQTYSKEEKMPPTVD